MMTYRSVLRKWSVKVCGYHNVRKLDLTKEAMTFYVLLQTICLCHMIMYQLERVCQKLHKINVRKCENSDKSA
jgi:hypothetical protein